MTAAAPADADAIKRQLYNRQEYVIGAETQRKYSNTDVLLVGLTGVGIEVAKNLILTGVKSVTLVDDSPFQWEDLSAAFFAAESDVVSRRPRAEVVHAKLAELNRFVDVRVDASTRIDNLIPQHHVAIFCDIPVGQLIAENALARRHNVKFVACESRGVSCAIFVDAGDSFTVVDPNAEETVACVVTGLSADGVVSCAEDKKHECSGGDHVYFTGLSGVDALLNSVEGQPPRLFKVVDSLNPFTVKIQLPEQHAEATAAARQTSDVLSCSSGYMHTTKTPVVMNFKSLEQAIAAPEFAFINDDESKLTACGDLHAIFTALSDFALKTFGASGAKVPGSRAMPSTAEQVAEVLAIAKGYNADIDVNVATRLISVARGTLNAMACFVGGVASQEVLKCASGKFTPIKQFLYFDAREVLQVQYASEEDRQPVNSRYDGQIAVIGRQGQLRVQQQRAFLVGAGALGCELVKNFALMGLGCGADGGSVLVTDMDVIELSNLSRQFLFRTQHIGHHKSRVAADSARDINGALSISYKDQKVGAETEAIFDDAFWQRQTLIVNALDNVAARRYVDNKCVTYGKPLFDSGTLGAKCNTQTVIPRLTESYGSSNDPPEKSFPICTLQNFPIAIEHTIAWAKDKFQAAFVSQPSDCNAYLHNADFLASLEQDPGQKPVVFRQIIDGLANRPHSAQDCVAWARKRYEELFVHTIQQLLHNLPLDKIVPETGMPFWSGAKRPPKPLPFDPRDPQHLDFIIHAAALIANVYGIAGVEALPADVVAQIAANTHVDAFMPKEQQYATSETDKVQNAVATPVSNIDLTPAHLPPKQQFGGLRLTVAEFEKDDDSNHHIDFITAVSNLRARNYAIPVADRVRTKMIAGRIIPAMVTTTALVTGLVGLEMLKYILGCNDINLYRNAFVNISLPLFALSSPAPPPGTISYTTGDGRTFTFTMWDSLTVDERRDLPIKELLALLKTRFGIDVTMMSLADGTMIYNEMTAKPERLAMPVSQALALIRKQPLDERITSLELILCAECDGQDVNVPTLHYKFGR